MDMLESTKCYIEYGVNPNVVEIDSKKKSLSSVEQRKILAASPGSKKKFTYQSLEGKSLVRNLD